MQVAVELLVPVYLAFVAKHVLADYVLQGPWMVFGKARETGWIAPLAAHAACHAALTLLLALAFAPSLYWLAAVDFVVHVAIDRGKAVLVRRLGLSTEQPAYWWAFGGDQALHQVTHFGFVVAMAAS